MINADKKMSEIVRNIIDTFGTEIFGDVCKVNAIISDFVTDNLLTGEKGLLKRVISSGAMSFVTTTNSVTYYSDRQKALYILIEREFIAESWAERALGWFDEALGYIGDELDKENDCIHQLFNASIDSEKEKNKSLSTEFLSPIDMLLDEDNNDNIVLFTEDNERTEFEQIALVPLSNKIYAILRPVLNDLGIADNEALVFAIDEVDDEECLVIVEDDLIIDKVFEEYYKMLRTAGVDVD